jgi:hypothetical protein
VKQKILETRLLSTQGILMTGEHGSRPVRKRLGPEAAGMDGRRGVEIQIF